jgi:acetyl esterase
VAAGCMNTQASYDLTEWEKFAGKGDRAWLRTEDEDVLFYHFKSRADFDTPEGRKILADCSMLSQISKDDPPLVLTNTNPDTEPKSRGEFIHHPSHVKAVQRRCQEIGVPCEVHLLGDPGQPRSDLNSIVVNFLLKALNTKKA